MEITKKEIQMVKEIEKRAYPKYMQQMQHINNLKQLSDYCECSQNNVLLLAEKDWYLIIAKNKHYYEVVDWASVGPVKLPLK